MYDSATPEYTEIKWSMVIEQYLRIANFELLQTDFSFLGGDNVLDSRNLLKKHLASFYLSNKTTVYGAC
jgi:hypothetical protein